MRREGNVKFYRRNLPHVHPMGATFFVTFRLANSVPMSVLLQLREERRAIEAQKGKCSQDDYDQMSDARHRRAFAKIESVLHSRNSGPHWLKAKAIADCVLSEIRSIASSLFALHACCVMSNHVHAVIRPEHSVSRRMTPLAEIMRRIKGRTANLCNRLLKRTGQYWERETFDHFVRNDDEHLKIIRYVLNNPVKCKLVNRWQDWPWNYCTPKIMVW